MAGFFGRRSRPLRPSHSRPSFGREYLIGILAAKGVPSTDENMLNLAQRSAMALGCQAGAYTAQLSDHAAFVEFVRRFSAPPAAWVDVVDEMAGWLWDWNSGCHEALVSQATKWANECAKPGGFISRAGVEPWEGGANLAPADDVEMWQLVHDRNFRH